MVENKVCKGCKWNHYPECHGTKMFDGSYMRIDNLRPTFNCGQKNDLEMMDFSISKKSDLEIRIEELESKIIELESKEVTTK